MPLADKWGVEDTPLALKPHGRRRETFLAQGIHRHDVVSARAFAGRRVGVTRSRYGIGRQTRNRIAVPPAVHAIHAIAGDALFWIRCPLEATRRALLAAEGEHPEPIEPAVSHEVEELGVVGVRLAREPGDERRPDGGRQFAWPLR